VKLIQAGQFR